MLLGQTDGVRVGDEVLGEEVTQSGAVGTRLLGRVIDGLGRPVDGRGPVGEIVRRPLNPPPLSPMERTRIDRPLYTGVRAVDLMTTLGRGQRMGVFAGPGVGKSTLLGTMARRSDADVNVVALIGERGREVKDFIEHSLARTGCAGVWWSWRPATNRRCWRPRRETGVHRGRSSSASRAGACC
ncbi:MAG: hypothetical protein IPI84_12485 [Holophagaceae bacterium]|nr:hypothetical protein [Holophagaceae bacterium]